MPETLGFYETEREEQKQEKEHGLPLGDRDSCSSTACVSL